MDKDDALVEKLKNGDNNASPLAKSYLIPIKNVCIGILERLLQRMKMLMMFCKIHLLESIKIFKNLKLKVVYILGFIELHTMNALVS